MLALAANVFDFSYTILELLDINFVTYLQHYGTNSYNTQRTA